MKKFARVLLILLFSLSSASSESSLVEVTFHTYPADCKIYMNITTLVGHQKGHYLGKSGDAILLDRKLIKDAGFFPILITKDGYQDKFEKVPNRYTGRWPAQGQIVLDSKSKWVALKTWVDSWYLLVAFSTVAAIALFVWRAMRRKTLREKLLRAEAIEEHAVEFDPEDPNIAAKVGSYRLTRKLGEGSYAKVYLGLPEDSLETDFAVAVKLIPAGNNQELLGRFYREVKLGRKLEHPNITRVYDWGEQSGMLYIAMELAEGPSLSDILERGPVPLDKALEYFKTLLVSVEYAHSHGVIHRDLKPANILFSDENVLKIADFGMARPTDGGEELTKSNSGLGTPAYMSPEQFFNAKRVDGRCDQFALGIVAYQLFSGVHPFIEESTGETIMKVIQFEPPRVDEVKEDVPAELGQVIARMLSKSADDRYPNLGEAIKDLEALVALDR